MSARTEIIVRGISEVTKEKLKKLKADQGFEGKDWAEWLTHMASTVRLNDTRSEMIQKNTRDGLLKLWVQNLGRNLPKIWAGESINALLPPEVLELERQGKDPDVAIPEKSAIVIGRGPSLYKHKHLEMLAQSDYAGTIIASDGALIDALKAGVRPDKYELFVTISVDGNPDKIWKWYDHELIDRYGQYIHACVCSSCSPNVIDRLERAGAKIHFFHPLFDDNRLPESYTQLEQYITTCEKHPNGTPAASCGGNAGSAAWVMAWALLRRNPVALIGITMGYEDGDDLTQTYYWNGILEAVRGNTALAQTQYKKVYNPDTGTYAWMDPVFEHYRNGWLDILKLAPYWTKTHNCTGGGALFGDRVITQPFKQFLEEHHT